MTPKGKLFSKKYDQLREEIRKFYLEHHCPPRLIDMQRACEIKYESTIKYYFSKMEDIRIVQRGMIIPSWVDNLYTSLESK
jgi:hypothetical protein